MPAAKTDDTADLPATVPLRLKRDTWKGEERVVADGSITEWPLEDAKRLINAGVADRADPLPGDA